MFDLKKIKHSTDSATWYKAIKLFEEGKVTNFKEDSFGYSAVVIGTHPYRVRISGRRFDEGDCECYLGQNDTLCKHMIAVAIKAVVKDSSLTDLEKEKNDLPVFSGQADDLTGDETIEVRKSISAAMKHIKAYEGPSRKWFTYQNGLDEGCSRLSEIVSRLPADAKSAKLLVKLLLRLDDKLCKGGVDDSNGTVGGFMEGVVEILLKFTSINPKVKTEFKVLQNRETCFGWEEPLVKLL